MAAPLRMILGRFLHNLAGPEWLAACFLLCALPTGLGCALLTPVGMFPDEFAHCARADGLLFGEIYGRKTPPDHVPYTINAGVMIHTGIYAVLFSRESAGAYPDKPVHEDARLEAESLPWFAGKAYFPTQMVEYFPIMYAPGALGLQAGITLGFTPLHAFFLGRVAMLLAFVALGTAAIGLARYGNGLLFAVLTLPTAINLGSSYNQDGMIIACCALAAALLTRCRAGPSPAWWAALAVLTALLCAKTPYAGLLLLCLAPLLAPGLPRRAACILLACVPPGLWLLHTVHFGFMPYQRPPYHPGPLWPGPRDILLHEVVPRDNMQVLLAHPAQIVLLPLTSFATQWGLSWRRVLGMISCDVVLLRPWEYPCLAVSLLTAAAGTLFTRPAGRRGVDAGLAGLALFAAFLGMEISMYLTFTEAGMEGIAGVQARYFLPFLPFFIFILPWLGSRLPRLAPGWFCRPWRWPL